MTPDQHENQTSSSAQRAAEKPGINLWYLLFLALVLSSCLLSCADQGSATISGDLQVANCTNLANKVAWKLDSSYVKIAVVGNQQTPVAAELRIQMYPGTLTQRDVAPQDLLVISISNPTSIQAGQAIPIEAYEARLVAEPKGSDPTKVTARAIFALGHTCPALLHPTSFSLQGQITFSSFQLADNAAIAGNLTLQVGPARPSSPKTEGSLQGNFQLSYDPPSMLGQRQVGYIPNP